MDVDAIQVGQGFPAVLQERIGSCDALLALIGREWLTIAGPDSRRRLDDPDDIVRMEITTALTRGIPVFPAVDSGPGIRSGDSVPG